MSMLTTDGLTMNQLAERNAEHVTTIAALEARCAALAAENARLSDIAKGGAFVMQKALMKYEFGVGMTMQAEDFIRDARSKTPATDALASLEAEPIGYVNCFTGRVFSLDEQPGADTDTAVYEPVYAAPPAPVTPDGYALVPVEPTDEMIAAAMNCEDVLFNRDESFCVQFGNIYEAMLAVAPKPEVTNGN
ncbi:hypothetical protein HZ491_004875 [Salmonella enterica]|nr:hypothetical protein [Salmonella enterica]EIE8403137.1 hypothetical protein [Salmonella enterica]